MTVSHTADASHPSKKGVQGMIISCILWWGLVMQLRRVWISSSLILRPGLSTLIRSDPIYPTPPLGQDMTQGQFLKQGLAGLNSEFSFSYTSCLTTAEEPSLPNYLPIAGGRIIGFIPFPRVLVLCEMQSVLSRNWTRIRSDRTCKDPIYGSNRFGFGFWFFCLMVYQPSCFFSAKSSF